MGQERVSKEFVSLVQQNEGIIYKVASFYADAENPIGDLYQEIVLNLWKGYSSFRGESKFSTWIYRIALNTCVSFFRRKKVKPDYVENLPEIRDEIDHKDEQIQELYKLINKLGNIEKALILLYLEDKPYKEIAEITGISVTNVATKINRIKEKLRKMSAENE
ncbi:RNA polymerase sigma factor [Dysgonomonas sp. 25]|uniref:RNA polymerase sigma factor n=1 Tax=Dysgonomonas sp. 25 TaxID=2302933 RepID=UPI001626758C|nr:sigma-70 family RNA polymerase sigma factor [Dysgonomonas sp. 25]NDV69918.1 sigma-70 family RNA polymerase sigma factor [Dysgonomonas sp. 25]